MLKAGVFVDVDNIMRNGGFGLKYKRVKELVEAQGATVIRATAYMSIDIIREEDDRQLSTRRETARQAVRRAGFRLKLKPVKRYSVDQNPISPNYTSLDARDNVIKANIDVDLTVDAMLQADELDYIFLVTGDGDFVRLVEALQNKGKKVDLLAFANVSKDLRESVDYAFNGFLMPDMIPPEKDRKGVHTGYMHHFNEEKGYGFITMFEGLRPDEVKDDIFVHISQFNTRGQGKQYLQLLRQRQTLLEFDLVQQPDGRPAAENVEELTWDDKPVSL